VWPADAPAGARGFTEPFPRLLEAASAVPGLRRLRFTSGHPSGCTAELARAMAELPAVCPHLHLPVQSGSDRILRAMRRGYTRAGYVEAVARLRAAVPDFAVTTDVIVGFPGETEEDFDETRTLLREIQCENAFVFKFSPRPGTPAAEMGDDVPDEEKARRNRILLADLDKQGQARNDAWIGRCVEVLAEGPSPRNAAVWSGRSPQHKIVLFPPPDGARPGDLLRVAIDRAAPQTLYGSVV
jgi:tRNA-2-methylthio-N6-dimethylallyladenosine synthase